MRHTTVTTDAGPLTIMISEAGAVRAAGFTADVEPLLALIHPALREPTRPTTDLGLVTSAVTSYLDGDLTALDDVPVQQRSDGSFLDHAWRAMRAIRPHEPVSYRRLAELAGRPAAVRAAASACARNAVALFVPCHRVLRTDGSPGGYRWGLSTKTWLLSHEACR